MRFSTFHKRRSAVEELKALKSFEHLKWGRNRRVLVGDDEWAERCQELRPARIKWYAPSQWRTTFLSGYIEFGCGRGWKGSKLFDLHRRTIGGAPAYIFERNEAVEILYRRLSATNRLRDYSEILEGGDLQSLAERVVSEVLPGRRLAAGGLRQQIRACLPGLSLACLEDLVATFQPAASPDVEAKLRQLS